MSYNLNRPVEEYATTEEILDEVASALREGNPPPSLSVRAFLSWFGAQRRGPNIVAWIDELLSQYELETHPNYVKTYIDDLIVVRLHVATGVDLDDEGKQKPELSDPVLRIGSLKSEKTTPVCVRPNDTLGHAVTLMMANGFSQLPVTSSPREIKGIISWRSIGERLASGVQGAEVRLFMEPAFVVSADASFFQTLSGIIENEYVLVRSHDQTLLSIFTTSDLSTQFIQLTEPFLLLSEIENHIRNLLQLWSDLPEDRVRSLCNIRNDYKDVFDLSFGDYVRILQSDLVPDPFPLKIDRSKFCEIIDSVRIIRNEVMHFSADPTPAEALTTLRNASQYLRKLQALAP